MNPVIDAILSRRSIRKFTDQEISQEIIDLLVKCGYHAPSGHNMQSWRFTVITKKEEIEELKECASIAAKQNKVVMYGFENPKTLILVSNDKRNPDGCQDASCAAGNVMLAAHSLGLGSVWINVLMTLRDEDPVKSLLDKWGVPGNHTIWATLALGWPITEGVKLQKNANVIKYV